MMNKKFLSHLLFSIVVFLVSASFASAQSGLIPCDGPDCNFDSFIALAQNIINYLVLISVPVAALAFAYAGFLMLTSAGSEEKIKHGKSIFTHVMVGFLFVLGGWLIVYTITTALLANPGDYSLFR